MIKLIAIAVSVVVLSGCASVLTDKTQPVKVETFSQTNEAIAGSKCDLQNDRGQWQVITPGTVFVRKSYGPLSIDCKNDKYSDADGKLISRVGGSVFGNILLGGGIGAIVDSSRGVAYNYPEWVQLKFGENLTFDRQDFKDAEPTPPVTENKKKNAEEKTVSVKSSGN